MPDDVRRVRRRVPSAAERRRVVEEARRAAPLPARPPVEAAGLALTLVLALGGLGVFLAGERVEPLDAMPYRLGVAVGFALAAVYLFAFFRLVARYGEPRTTLLFATRGAIAVVAAIGASLAAIGGLAVLNVRLDRGPETVQRALVVDKTRRPTSGTLVQVAAWWDAGKLVEVDLADDAYDRIVPRRTHLLVKTRPGAFGWPWIEGTPAIEAVAAPAVAATTASVGDGPPTLAPAATGPSSGTPADETARGAARELFTRGTQRLRDGDRDAGLADLKRAIDTDPSFVLGYRALEEALLPANEFDTAITYWTKLIEVEPQNGVGWEGRARVRRAKRDLDGALADARQACQLGRSAACEAADTIAQGR